MSLQVCHYCGWSKVTTYQGLRIHQGKMGCTQRGVRIAETEQPYMSGNVGLPNKQMDLWVDVYISVKTDATDCGSEISLRVCHCGWTNVTTYRGLRIHQGKKGCTPKAVRIPAREQNYYKNQWEEVHRSEHQPAKRGIIKEEMERINVHIKEEYEAPAISRHSSQRATNSAASHRLHEFSTSGQVSRSIRERPTAIYPEPAACPRVKNYQATIKEEPYTSFAIPQQSFQTDTNSKSRDELHDFSSGVQVNRSVRECPATPPLPIVVRPKKKERNDQTSSQVNRSIRERPTIYPVPAARLKEKSKNDQILSQVTDRGAMTGYAAEAATIKKEPCSPFAIPQQSFQTDTNSKSRDELYDFSSGVQVNRSVRECPATPPLPTVVRPKKKERNDQTLLQARPKTSKSELELKLQMRQEKMQKKAAERACESVPDSKSNTQTNSAAVDVTTKEDPKSLCDTARVSDVSTGMTVKQLALMYSASTQETAVQPPKEKHQEEQKLPQAAKPLARKLLAATHQETAVQPKEQERKHPKLPLKKPDSTSAATKMNPAAAEATTKEHPKALCETAQLSDSSTVLKVKQLAQIFSATNQETAVRPKEKHQEEQNLPQAKPLAQKFLAATHQETAVQPKEQERKDQKLPLMPDSTSAMKLNPAAAEATTKEHPKALCETAQLSDSSTELKMKQLAQMFLAINQETGVQPKEKHNEEQKLAQARQERSKSELEQKIQMREEKMSEIRAVERACESVPDSTSTTQTNDSADDGITKEDPKTLCETAQVSNESTGMMVKQLALMYSASTQETAVQPPKEKHQEEQKLPQAAKPLARKLLAATHQETAVQPKEQERKHPKLPLKKPDSTSAATKMNPAAAEATTKEHPKALCETAQLSDSSTVLKVKQLAQIFSATNQETAVRPKEKHQEERKLVQMPDSTSAATKMNPVATEATTKEYPEASCETAQLSDSSTRLKVKQLAQMFSATNQETAVRLKEKHQEERKPAQ